LITSESNALEVSFSFGMKKFFQPVYTYFLAEGIVLFLLFSFWCNHIVVANASGKLYSDAGQIPYNDVALVPGTSKKIGRWINPYFKYRMEAAAELYKKGKIKHILVSGDNSRQGYDEPTDMMNYLVTLGVPKKAITRDYAGFRTFDSMIRAKEIFGVNTLTVVSQQFHNERAIYIGEYFGMNVIGFNAKMPSSHNDFREFLARTKAVLDVHVLWTKPKFLGKKELIN
jgi:SanA protein